MARIKHTLLNPVGKKYLFIFNKDCLTAQSNYALMHSHHETMWSAKPERHCPQKKQSPVNGIAETVGLGNHRVRAGAVD